MSTTAATHTLPQLADPDGYTACRWDLARDGSQRAYWLQLFRDHFPLLVEEAITEAHDEHGRGAAAQTEFCRYLDALDADPGREGRLTILAICLERERVLRRHGFDDPYRLAKRRQNDAALRVLPRVLEELDAVDDRDARDIALIEGVFAGNIFDMGATHTNSLFRDGGGVDFHETRGRLKPRPWLMDGLDAWQNRRPHRSALLFVDNAGPDITLGMLPFARQMLRDGARVILAANSEPSLNDVTIEELQALIHRAGEIDPPLREALADGRLRLIGSGNGAPLIDLTRLSGELCAAATDVDLVVLEGMGRAVESNLDARFACDALKIAMIKDSGVAEALGGEVYDLVCRYEPI